MQRRILAADPALAPSPAAGPSQLPPQLAVDIGHELAQEFPDGRLFLDLSASADPLAELLCGIGVTDPPASSSERAALWRTRTTGRRILVILDDAREADEVRPLLPGAGDRR